MIPRLYAAGTTSFTTEGLGALADATKCVTNLSINGVPELNMTYPTYGQHADEISERCVIVADRDRRVTAQPYIVKSIDKSTPGIMQIYAVHLAVELLDGIALGAYTAGSLSAAISSMQSHATDPIPVAISSELSSATAFNHSYPSTVKRALGGMEGSFLDTYGGEWDFISLTAILRSRMGSNNGVVIRWGKNMTKLQMTTDWSGVYTGIYPYWVDGDSGAVKQMSSPIYSLGTFTWVKTLMLDATSDFQDEPSDADLLAYATQYATDHDLTNPKITWNVTFQSLREMPEYHNIALLEDVAIGDTVTIYLESFGVNASARVVTEKYDVLRNQYTDLVIGSVKANLASTIAVQQAQTATAIKASETSLLSAIRSATEAITGNSGGYIRTVLDNDGKPTELLIMDTDDITTATNVWRFNLSGWGHSSTGYAGPYTLAATASGAINASMITTGTLAANVVTACQLVAGTITSADGTTFVLDLSSGTLTIDGSDGGINLKNCGVNVQSSQTFLKSNYSSTDVNRISQILLGNVTPTSSDYTKYDFYGDGTIGLADQLLCNRIVNTGQNLTITWYAQLDTSKSQILKVWRVLTGAQSATATLFNVTAGGTSFVPSDAAASRSALESAGREFVSASANTSVSIELKDGEMAMMTYVASSSAGNVDIKLLVNGSSHNWASYSYAGTSANYTGGIIARSSSGTFNGWISVHDGLVEVWGSGRRGTDNVRGDVYLGYNQSSVTSLTFSVSGSIKVTKISA